MRSMAAMTLEQALSFSESQVMVTVQTEDAREGRLAFNEKRKPVWTGR
jgi:1,4-dihydroxy-2-naphthoyl-CoA synthase